MTETTMTAAPTSPIPAEADLAAAAQRVLASSSEPLTVSKIRAKLPTALRGMDLEVLGATLQQLVAANLLYAYPKYRSQQDRFWDRDMPVHVAALIRETVEENALALAELRRKVPAYATELVESVLRDQLNRGLLYTHPALSKRAGVRYGVKPPDAKEYLREELIQLFARMGEMGFSQAQLREGALELLHEEEWASKPRAEAISTEAADASSAEAVENPQASPDTVP